MKINKHLSRALLLLLSCSLLSSCGVKEFFNDAKDTIVDVYENTKDFVVDASQKVGEFFVDIGEKIKNTAEPIIDDAKEGICYAYNNVVSFTKAGIEAIENKASEIAKDTETFFTGVDMSELDKYTPVISEVRSEQIKDCPPNFVSDPSISHKRDQYDELNKFVTFLVSSELYDKGYQVYKGAAYSDSKIYSGLIFTTNKETIEYKNEDTYVCGFIQLSDGSKTEDELNIEIVNTGVIAAPVCTEENDGAKEGYIIRDFATIDGFGGIYKNSYFEYEQKNEFVLKVSYKENKAENYSKKYDIFDFDNKKVISDNNASIDKKVEELAASNPDEYCMAVTASNAIAEIEEQLPAGVVATNAILLTEDTIDTVEEEGSKTFLENVTTCYKANEPENEQITLIEKDTVSDVNEGLNIDEERATNGLINTIGSALATVGTTFCVIAGLSSGAPVIIGIVAVTGTLATVYNVSNLIEGITDLKYGLNNDSISPSNNPVLNKFSGLLGDAELAKTIYHCVGIASNLITGLTVPATKALNICRSNNLGVFSTCINVIRAVFVKLCQTGIAALGSMLIGNLVGKVVTYITDNRCVGRLFQFGTTLISAILIYRGLEKLDTSLNISGLHPKAQIAEAYRVEVETQDDAVFTTDRFNSLDNGGKEDAINAMVEMAQKEYGIQNKPTIYYDYTNNPSSSGFYRGSDNSITIFMNDAESQSWRGVSDTVGHEMWHAYQYQEACAGNTQYIDGFNNYISYDQSPTGYRTQLLESEAFDHGSYFSNMLNSLFGLSL